MLAVCEFSLGEEHAAYLESLFSIATEFFNIIVLPNY